MRKKSSKIPWQGKFLGYLFLIMGSLALLASVAALTGIGLSEPDPEGLIVVFGVGLFFALLSWGYLKRRRWILVLHAILLFFGILATGQSIIYGDNITVAILPYIVIGGFVVYCNVICLRSSVYSK